ncbi:MucR family transcriptional regulator [Serratia sp. DD3]|uniref:MucR family transcriptional regulator n=1 Tax=Serratia sp. DD3 TaxID=1410619 RepID=UPI00055B3337|nr:MucR family transcriptional regulator [Serratia sp. DD3]
MKINDDTDLNKVKCLECGKFFDFLAPHVNRAHEMTLMQYREKWRIPRHQALASITHRRRCSEVTKERIRKGDLVPDEQIRLMAIAYKKSDRKKTTSSLLRERSSENARKNQIWKYSPVIKTISEELQQQAIRRMQARPESKEWVKDIAKDLGLSITYLYDLINKNTHK